MSMEFEWDENKAEANLSKHRVSFDEAKTVFDDSFYIDFCDPNHSDDEDRYIIMGSRNNIVYSSCRIPNAIMRLV